MHASKVSPRPGPPGAGDDDHALAPVARWQAINARAKELGAIHHRFLGSADGSEIIVPDEWESPEAFRKFFESSPEIPRSWRKQA